MAVHKRGRGFELRAAEKQSQVVVRAGLEPGTAGLRVRHADPSATLSRKKERICLKLSIPLVFLKLVLPVFLFTFLLICILIVFFIIIFHNLVIFFSLYGKLVRIL